MKSAFKYWLTDSDGIFGFLMVFVVPALVAYAYQPFIVATVFCAVYLSLLLYGYCSLNGGDTE